MSTIGLFYGSETGNTRKVAKSIVKKLGEDVVELFNVSKASADDVAKFSALILGSPTLGDGELVDSWKEFLPTFKGVDLTGKTVAIYGLGDQESYGHEFCDAMSILFEAAKAQGATVIGSWPTDDYEFSKSKAVVDGEFVGLALDNDNQKDMTDERVDAWLEQVKDALLG